MKRAAVLFALVAVAGCASREAARPTLPTVTLLSPDSANHQQARFSPDGKRIFWWEPSRAGFRLWTAAADLKNPVQVPVTAVGLWGLYWSPDGSKIALGSSDSALAQPAVIAADGSAPRQIPTPTGYGIATGWNHDGDRLAYLTTTAGSGGGSFQTFVTSLSRGGTTPMVPGETRPYIGFWSPDGSRIAYNVVDGSHTTIWIADSVGGNRRQLIPDGFEAFAANAAPWSPDGKWIAYESRRTGFSDIWIVPADSGGARQLTHDIRNDTGPIWSQDSKWLAFLSDRGKQSDIWIVSLDGAQELRVTDDGLTEEPLQWLDKSRFAFLTGEGLSGIWSISLADSTEHRLTPDSIRADSPVLSPDGKLVAFLIQRSAGNDIAVMPTAGGSIRTLVHGGNNSRAIWSPDGTHLGYTSDAGGTSDVWTVDIAGGAPKQIENWPGFENGIIWSGDGATIYFVSDRESRLNDIWSVPAAGGEPVRLTRQGSLQSPLTIPGRPEMYASALDANGHIAVVQVMPDGSVVPRQQDGNAFPSMITAQGDSLVVSLAAKGGGFSSTIVPANGKGQPQVLLSAGETFNDLSRDGSKLLYQIPVGSSYDLGIRNRADGASRRLTTTNAIESQGKITPDGSTVIFTRSRPVRRVAIADLSKLLGTPKP